MSYLQAQNRVTAAKAGAIEAARKMQTSVIDAANKADRVPPKYALKELVGKGSFGAVYKGYAFPQVCPYLYFYILAMAANYTLCTAGWT